MGHRFGPLRIRCCPAGDLLLQAAGNLCLCHVLDCPRLYAGRSHGQRNPAMGCRRSFPQPRTFQPKGAYRRRPHGLGCVRLGFVDGSSGRPEALVRRLSQRRCGHLHHHVVSAHRLRYGRHDARYFAVAHQDVVPNQLADHHRHGNVAPSQIRDPQAIQSILDHLCYSFRMGMVP